MPETAADLDLDVRMHDPLPNGVLVEILPVISDADAPNVTDTNGPSPSRVSFESPETSTVAPVRKRKSNVSQ